MSVKIFALLALIVAVNSQQEKIPDNAGKNIAARLKICYNKTESNLLYRDNRFPTTINVLIDLIRRIEDGNSVQDARSFAIELIHRFRQDGIVKLDSLNQLSLPFSPDGYQADKNRLLLRKYIPGTAENFPEDTLNPLEKCSLHFMLSNTFELARRDIEDDACTKLGRYRIRTRRNKENLVETFQEGKKPEVETANPNRLAPRGYNNNEFSRCPVESGVVYTKWGAIQAGTVIAAIAAGFEDQSIEEQNYRSTSIYAATLAGDIAETALQQGIQYASYEVGVSGDWKSVLVPRWYLMSENGDNLHEMTDAEIRADLDGLIIGMNVKKWKERYANLKLSQLLDMYYSQRGVFGSEIKACNRNLKANATEEILRQESYGFSVLYNNYASVKGTFDVVNLPKLVDPVITSYLDYYPKLSNRDCNVKDEFGRFSTEITIVLDTDWPYNIIQPALSYLLDNLDINKFESNYTIISGKNGNIIVNASTSILDFHEFYNETTHRNQPSGFELSAAVPIVEDRLRLRLENERSQGKSSGKSMIVLLVPYLKQIPADQGSFMQNRMSSLYKDIYPDLKVLVLGAGNKESYSTISSNPDDIYILPDTTTRDADIMENMKKIIKRISEVPRRITNPKCGATMSGESSTTSTELYVEPGTINYYKISPNYFFGSGNREVKIRGQSETITVCYSRSDVRPSKETLPTSCEDITAKEKIISLTDDCIDTVSSCSPIYISVEAPIQSGGRAKCLDASCRYPDNIQFTITTTDFVCVSSSSQIIYSSILLIATTLYVLY